MAMVGSSQALDKSFHIVQRTAGLVGLDASTAKNRLTVLFILSVAFLMVIYVLCFYTLWILGSDWLGAMESSLNLLLTIQGTSKIWTGYVHKSQYCELFQQTKQIYERLDASDYNRPMLEKSVRMMEFMLKSLVIVYTCVGTLTILFVILTSVLLRERFLVLTVFVPFVDYSSPRGYLIVTIVHCLMIMFCVNGYLASDAAFLFTVLPIIGYTNSLKCEINDFNNLLQESVVDEDNIAIRLMHICKLHQMIVEFEVAIVDFFSAGNLIQIGSQACMVLVMLFLGYLYQYVQAYIILVAIIFQLTLYCGTGTIITNKNIQMCNDIYTIEWYRLGKHEQKTVAFMLHRSQLAKDLTIGGFAPLNVVTYSQILKTVYTFFTMLVTMLEQ